MRKVGLSSAIKAVHIWLINTWCTEDNTSQTSIRTLFILSYQMKISGHSYSYATFHKKHAKAKLFQKNFLVNDFDYIEKRFTRDTQNCYFKAGLIH